MKNESLDKEAFVLLCGYVKFLTIDIKKSKILTS